MKKASVNTLSKLTLSIATVCTIVVLFSSCERNGYGCPGRITQQPSCPTTQQVAENC